MNAFGKRNNTCKADAFCLRKRFARVRNFIGWSKSLPFRPGQIRYANKILDTKKAIALLDNAVREYAGRYSVAKTCRVMAYAENP